MSLESGSWTSHSRERGAEVRLTWPDLLIEQVDDDSFTRCLAEWSGRVDDRGTLAFLNRFGSWFFYKPEGHVEMLDAFTGQVERVADTKRDLIAKVNDPAWHRDYLLSALVYRLHCAGRVATGTQCYMIAPHPAHGGPNPRKGQDVDLQRVMVLDLFACQNLSAQAVGPEP
jgi:hypothetical protein